MRKFFFDDVRDVPDESWDLARNVQTAKDMLSRKPYDVWSLDHDIGFQMLCEDCYEETIAADGILTYEEVLKRGCTHMQSGTTLAKWAVEHVQSWPELIVIHSANTYGAERMHGILSRYTKVLIVPYNKEVLNSIRRS